MSVFAKKAEKEDLPCRVEESLLANGPGSGIIKKNETEENYAVSDWGTKAVPAERHRRLEAAVAVSGSA